jgi:AcrR family transcriptional regulator
MLDRDQHIVSAAVSVFARYGVSKTTMNDIAVEAGVSRQTLYNAFPGKTELLRAAVRMEMARSLEEISVDWAGTTDLGARIDSYFPGRPDRVVRCRHDLPRTGGSPRRDARGRLRGTGRGQGAMDRVFRDFLRRGGAGQPRPRYHPEGDRRFPLHVGQDGEGRGRLAGRPAGAAEGHETGRDRVDGPPRVGARRAGPPRPLVVHSAFATARLAITFTRFAR